MRLVDRLIFWSQLCFWAAASCAALATAASFASIDSVAEAGLTAVPYCASSGDSLAALAIWSERPSRS